jgi:hypothetical protein
VSSTRREQATPFAGSLGLGVDVRRTIRSMAAGQSTIYTRQRIRCSSHQESCTNCPIVWLFDPTARVISQGCGTFRDELHGGTGTVYASFYWFSKREYLSECLVTRSKIAYSVSLLRRLQRYDKEEVRRLLLSMPESRHCRCDPW